ncbi:MAG: YicC family protein [Gammaproteobacteria bacterium]|nr:YicC family protein [Gammaproteobacteria bacterium]
MINSMTGFARKEMTGDWGTLAWEIRSVNHRYLELFFRLPEEARPLEGALREVVAKHISRGKLECTLRLDKSHRAGEPFTINEALLGHVIAEAGKVGARLSPARALSPLELLRWPGVTEEVQSDPASMHAAAIELLDQSLISLNAARAREGERIAEMISQRCELMLELLAKVRVRLPEVQARMRAKLHERLGKLDLQADETRFEQELVLLLQKMDVDEELDRLGSHVQEAVAVMGREEPVGRRLDFLMQEFNREANTLASKSQDTETTRAAVEIKVLVEQMREQVQNIE